MISFNYDGTNYFYIRNLQGDVVAILNASETEVAHYNYDAYGNVTMTGSSLNPYTYRGYRFDKETGLYYLTSRYYNPESGRFISSDGLLGETGDVLSTNMYAYCNNDPINNIDPYGCFRMKTWILAMGIDSAILSLATWLNVSWMSMLAPLKYAAKELAKKIFSVTIAPLLVRMVGILGKIIVPLLTFVGITALAAGFNVGVTGILALFRENPWRAVVAIASIGGFIAAIFDYKTDGKWDGWIKW